LTDILWLSAAILLVLTIYSWRTWRHMKANRESIGLQRAYLAAAICGAIGTLCFVLAALI
jgi:hypothetical protein